jgi:hypothetical protein
MPVGDTFSDAMQDENGRARILLGYRQARFEGSTAAGDGDRPRGERNPYGTSYVRSYSRYAVAKSDESHGGGNDYAETKRLE